MTDPLGVERMPIAMATITGLSTMRPTAASRTSSPRLASRWPLL